jgi:class 3 adenylate cyclase
MALKDDLQKEVRDILRLNWKEREGRKVPEAEDVQLGNDAVTLDGTVLYADLAESTQLVDQNTQKFAAEIYKSFLVCACRIIIDNGGVITAFDGDRVMAVYSGGPKNTSAARTALKINWTVKQMIIPEVHAFYDSTKSSFTIKHSVGIDTGSLFVARTGIRGSNDLVWVGGAANWAAKLSGLREENYSSWISQTVFSEMLDTSKYGKDGRIMWEQRQWKGKTIYRSNWWWEL